jgi:GNAT superfamily N-acetyltransferase
MTGVIVRDEAVDPARRRGDSGGRPDGVRLWVHRSSMRILQLGKDDGLRLRAIRLRALQDVPDAFATTFEEASTRPADEWSAQLARLPTFVAVVDGNDAGMVRCDRDRDQSTAAWLLSMWVAPKMRRRGVGAALVGAVVDWARAGGFERLLLEVADHNTPAIALYTRMGFTPNGIVSTLPPPRQDIAEHQLELRLLPPRR